MINAVGLGLQPKNRLITDPPNTLFDNLDKDLYDFKDKKRKTKISSIAWHS